MTSIKDMDVVILCGGLGKRLRSVNSDLPKVMVEFDGRPFLNLVLEFYKSQGSRRFVLCIGYKAQMIEEYYKKEKLGVEIVFSHEPEPLGTGGAIKNAKAEIKSDPFIALNGDVFCAVDLKAFKAFHDEKKGIASLVVSQIKENKDFGSIDLDSDQRITAFKEKQQSSAPQFVNAGIYCFTHKVLDLMPEEKKFSLEYDVFPKLTGLGFYGFPIKEEFLDIGTPERLTKAKEMLKK